MNRNVVKVCLLVTLSPGLGWAADDLNARAKERSDRLARLVDAMPGFEAPDWNKEGPDAVASRYFTHQVESVRYDWAWNWERLRAVELNAELDRQGLLAYALPMRYLPFDHTQSFDELLRRASRTQLTRWAEQLVQATRMLDLEAPDLPKSWSDGGQVRRYQVALETLGANEALGERLVELHNQVIERANATAPPMTLLRLGMLQRVRRYSLLRSQFDLFRRGAAGGPGATQALGRALSPSVSRSDESGQSDTPGARDELDARTLFKGVRFASTGGAEQKTRPSTHTFGSGDTLRKLARIYATTVPAIMASSGIRPGEEPDLGRVLDLPEIGDQRPIAIAHLDGTFSHWIGNERNPGQVARRYRVTFQQLVDANPGRSWNREDWGPGQVLRLPLLASVGRGIRILPERVLEGQ